MNNLCDYLSEFPRFRVAVLGDLMLDRYIWGNATRISPEAPVPVVEVTRSSAVPGGAANVARNLLSLGASALAVGCIGCDQDGEELRRLLEQAGADISALQVDSDRPTTVKTRVLAGNQQVVRIDSENKAELASALRQKLLQSLQQELQASNIQALILEDYAKGVFDQEFMQAVCDCARAAGVFTTLDPHPSHLFSVQGLKLMTPNRAEAFTLAGRPFQPSRGVPLEDQELLRVGAILMDVWQPELLLITLGAEGMVLFRRDAPRPYHIPTEARQVFDVSGAGDTVMATMTMALLAGACPEEAARIANAAAGVVVGYVGTAAIDAQTLRGRLCGQS